MVDHDRHKHGRACIGEHLTFCVDRDGHLFAFPDLEHPGHVRRAINGLLLGLLVEPERVDCLLGDCDGHRELKAATPPW